MGERRERFTGVTLATSPGAIVPVLFILGFVVVAMALLMGGSWLVNKFKRRG